MGTGEGGHNVNDQGGWQGAEGWVVLTVPFLLHDYSQLQAAPGCSINLVPCPRGMDLGWPWDYQTKLSARQRSSWQGGLRWGSQPPWRPIVVGPEGFSPQIFACRDRATEVGETENPSVAAPPGSVMTELEGT